MSFCFSRRLATLALRGLPMSLAVAGLVACSTPSAPPQIKPSVAAPVAATVKPASALPAAPAGPVSPGLSGRFPDPAVVYRTPGLSASRAGLTTQAELQSALTEVIRANQNSGNDTGPFVHLLALGNSQSGAPIEALLITRLDTSKPSAVLKGGRPTVFLYGQVHGDEPASAEALLLLAQELSVGKLQPVLDRVNVLILPRANPDGAFNQRAVTANGVDLDVDQLLLSTPEARAQARLLREYQPVVVVDAREYAVQDRFVEKFGGVQGDDAWLHYGTAFNQSEFITKASEEWFRKPMLAALKAQGLRGDWHHGTSASATDKKVFMAGVQPDNARNVHGLRNAVSLTIESRGAGFGRVHIQRRVHTQVTLMTSILQTAAERAADLVKLRKYVDAVVRSQACNGPMLIDAAMASGDHTLQLLDPVSGADKPVTVKRDTALSVRDTRTRARPCGYWLASDQSAAVARLRGLGVRVEQLIDSADIKAERNGAPAGRAPKGKGKADSASSTAKPAKAAGSEHPGSLFDANKGSYFVPLSQPLGNLVAVALEPGSHGYLGNKVIESPERVARIVVLPKVKRVLVP
ncbi:MAG: hypothetical protein RLZZ618_4091 [Pseudomonadota bacterium]